MIMLSTSSIRFSISAIFVEILAPPTTVNTFQGFKFVLH
jgi:hypothetical protein